MSLSDLQYALDQLGVACWFNRLPPHVRPWEGRQGHESVMLRAREYALKCGATAEQVTDCDRYAFGLAIDDKVPLTLAGRSWAQFAAGLRTSL
ncbi:hypothetical protein [Mycolicibacterium aubagnense]|uniref:Uncharacterized protein n=1 Tax=Mycolicibacterium aubagnense TaxID=319707 RepID=A0ABN5YKM0_9MYCO|nr:hypothetical protein [Mycolicibacterium aubagnense]TLH48994.1 hypothetical protein C1S80_29375 [Mycolicibacterium aubagnense]BBX82217.1 hypothetical protein MAUB_00900 [Mycolicibacterium aubagnense]